MSAAVPLSLPVASNQPRPDQVVDIYISDFVAYRVTFKAADYDRLMEQIRSKRIDRVKFTPWENYQQAEFYIQQGKTNIIVYVTNALPISRRPVNPEKVRRQLVYTLAHESQHACQPLERRPTLRESTLSSLPLIIPGIAGLGGLYVFASRLWSQTHGLLSGVWHLFQFGAACTLACVIGLIALPLMLLVGYRLEWSERDANAFARTAVRRPEWDNLIAIRRLRPEELVDRHAPPKVYPPPQKATGVSPWMPSLRPAKRDFGGGGNAAGIPTSRP